MQVYPVPPGCSQHEQEHEKKRQLLEMYQGFALEMHRGMYLTQLMADLSYQDIHCQLMEDMATLKLDQSNGRIIEFPLANVSKTYCLTKVAGKWYPAEKGQQVPSDSDHVVVVVFSKRKLAFVFKDHGACNRFLTCFELLVWRAHEVKDINTTPCPTPRLVRNPLTSLREEESVSFSQQDQQNGDFKALYQAQGLAEGEERTASGGRIRETVHTSSMVQWPSSRPGPLQSSAAPIVPLNHVHDAVARLVDSGPGPHQLPFPGPVAPAVTADDETLSSDHTLIGDHSSSESSMFRPQDVPEEI
jgi:hypothetical protein